MLTFEPNYCTVSSVHHLPRIEYANPPSQKHSRTMAGTAAGITSLTELLASMSPTLDHETTYVFTTTTTPLPNLLSTLDIDKIEMLFREAEGWTLILPQDHARGAGLESMFPCRKVTLNVHSSLDAVGFLAAVTTRLAKEVGIGVNPVSGFYHDHLFVPVGKEDEVMRCLMKMAEESRGNGT